MQCAVEKQVNLLLMDAIITLMSDTIFDKIVRNEVPNWKIWEDENFLAFLTPFPITPGATVVIPKKNPGDYAFDLDSDVYLGLMAAVKTVAQLLGRVFETKVALVFEGTAVPYVHAKLYPMHGLFTVTDDERAHDTVFYENYPGFIDTRSGPKMEDGVLDAIRSRITGDH